MNTSYLMLSLDKKIPSEKIFILNEKMKDIPEDKSSEIMAFTGLKDPTTSLLLGVFLGGVGAHNFYIGEKKKGIAFAVSFALSFILMIISIILEVVGAIRFAETSVISNGITIDGDPSLMTAGLILLLFSAIALCVVAVAGLIDGLLSYKRAQDKNFEKLLTAIDRVI